MQKRQSFSVVASVAINLAQLYEDVNLSTVKTHPPSDDTQSGQNVDPFVDDEENEIDNRIGTLRSNEAINERDREIVAILRNMLDKYNSLAKCFRFARNRYQQENCTNIKFKLISKRTTDGRTYSLPSASEVAALIVGDVKQLSKDRDIIIERRMDFIWKRTGESPLILRSKRLFQQFLVDAYTMVESKRLKFFRCKQPQLRVDKYKCLHESLINGDVDAARLGKRIILPSTFIGGPRYMMNNCKDAFTICKYTGYPSYFINMTCNPEWDEIRREVTPIGLKAEDRPDILCRVFKIKLDGLIDGVKEGKIFGKILGYVCTVEFQKRGLPHAHILLFMSNKFKPQTPDDIDKHITAEIPDENERANLHGAVQNYIVHGPCELLLKFGCHINVEYTCQTSFIKYLFKYVHKGNDRVTATLYNAGDSSEATQVVDEIRNYYDCRYISDEQPVVYGETSNVNDIVERAISHKSMFLGWMAANMSYPCARSLTYAEFPTKFVWKDNSSKWFPRKKGFAIGRLTHVLAELTMSNDEIKQLCLMDIDKILYSYGKTLKDYPPMPLATEVDSPLLTKRVIREELNFNRDDLKKNASDMLAIAIPEQRYAFDKIVTAVYCDEGGFFFVYGHGGTGKIFL
ncbi:uncharacterized protein LOC110264987 [Arachis ipaensis]|uniref:uncharacterized protein LOC110264987 n=1 Tax=Arachis ipaensis TaxID=130454 RepID=UPI000A2B939A|nr:uncharacterized protein LOC110264987 [Arachis ipaensis]